MNILRLSGLSGLEPETLKSIFTYSIPALLSYGLVFMRRRHAFGTGVAAMVFALVLSNSWNEDILYRGRSFFGVIKVMDDSSHEYRYLIHGTTQHGKQSLDPGLRQEPIAYYHREGPIGQVFKQFSGPERKERVALIGLGTGTLASYGEPGQRLTFYEIDPAMKRVATDPRLFSYLEHCRAACQIVLGDARLKLEEAPDGSYGLIVIDAFSSDAIPVHLLTREALRLYFSKLQESGAVAIHISNRHLDLEPVVARLAGDAGLVIRVQNDTKESAPGKTHSHWALLARKEADLRELAHDGRWVRPKDDGQGPVWTDDYSNLLRIFKWS
jgi:spermidine synthase